MSMPKALAASLAFLLLLIIASTAPARAIINGKPVTGSETVLDAISKVQGLPPVASQKRIWVARPWAMSICCCTIACWPW